VLDDGMAEDPVRGAVAQDFRILAVMAAVLLVSAAATGFWVQYYNSYTYLLMLIGFKSKT